MKQDYLCTDEYSSTGGKAKPLKAPKKEKKEMDEDEIAFKAKQQAGARHHVLESRIGRGHTN